MPRYDGRVWFRLLAILIVVALLPTIEVTEQAVHVVEHLIEGDDAAHSAHHDEGAPDCCDHCGGLVHVCATHQTLAVTPVLATTARLEHVRRTGVHLPSTLRDLAAREPADRPPIG